MTGQPLVCLMGPTASSKTDLAVHLCRQMPLDVISVDSALVYRGMDIGTAKPDASVLAEVPHRLIDIREPWESYSAGEFVKDATREIARIHARGRIPLLVGGTMLYFRAVLGGIADMPAADPGVRAELDRQAKKTGWPSMHGRLARVDPTSAARIEPNDRQRIQRALEVYELSGRPLSDWHSDENPAGQNWEVLKIALMPAARAELHRRIASRLEAMFADGFLEEVRKLRTLPGLTGDHPSMRSVGYRQIWSYLEDDGDVEAARYRALVATRQLAKRQLTWLRSENGLKIFDPLEKGAYAAISCEIEDFLRVVSKS